jgi:hypothetical protein
MANWHRLEQGLDRNIGRAFGEAVRFCPMTASGRADPVRLSQNISGVLHLPADDGIVNIGAGHGEFSTTVAGCDAALVVQRSLFPDLVAREGDKIQAIEGPGTPWYKVSRVNNRYSSILVVALTAA